MTENRNQTPNLIYQGTDEYYRRIGYASAMTIAGGDDPIKPKAQSNGGGDPYSNSLAYIPPPKDGLPGFPGAERDKPKGGRPRWKLPNGDIGEWDGQHGEVEVYNPRGKHKDVWDKDGQKIKPPVPGRKTNTFDHPRYNWNTPATSWWIVGAAATIGTFYTIWKFENPALILIKP